MRLKALAILAAVICFSLSSCAFHNQEVVNQAMLEGMKMGSKMARSQEGEYSWQLVKVPATVRGGVMIPEHDEHVLVRAGEGPTMPYMIPPSKNDDGMNTSEKRSAKIENVNLYASLTTAATLPPVRASTAEAVPALPVDAQQIITKSKMTQKGPGTLSQLFPSAIFNGKTKDLQLDREISFYNMEDLKQILMGRLDIFVDFSENTIIFSDIKEIVYETGFFTEDLAKDLKELLNNPDAKAVVNKTAGVITVYDDPKGHANVSREVQAKKDQYIQYAYKLVLKQGNKTISAAEGDVSPASPARFADGGIILELRGQQGMAKISFAKYPDIVTGYISREGGDLTATRDDFRLDVNFRKK